MKLSDFKLLSIDDRADITFAGEFISSIYSPEHRISLYLVTSTFYVEVFYNILENQIDFIDLADPDRLGLYPGDSILLNLL